MSCPSFQSGVPRVETPQEQAFLNLLRTADALQAELVAVLKPTGLSQTGFNVLHILRGAGEYGLTSREVGQRMITRDPDLTRLLDRLETRGLVTRLRCEKDRRRVYSKLTPAGAQLLAEYDGPVVAKLHETLAHLGPEKLAKLTELLIEARKTVDPTTATCTGATCTGAPSTITGAPSTI